MNPITQDRSIDGATLETTKRKYKATKRKYRAKNKDKINAHERIYKAQYRAKNRDKINAYSAKYAANNHEKELLRGKTYRAKIKEMQKTFTKQLGQKLIETNPIDPSCGLCTILSKKGKIIKCSAHTDANCKIGCTYQHMFVNRKGKIQKGNCIGFLCKLIGTDTKPYINYIAHDCNPKIISIT